ncbi:CpsB/CapC family capsule biosynthesis tyrosine phosphatase [Caloramator sp. Dgby_cultured_2]|uniref:CpsB/CapC family capsule biosynthesis tyrosine phosphatase n=1 Tax=Caloramator sp. Dgby_cultured_2 TaxID=3029174 RepID=UPI00406C1917
MHPNRTSFFELPDYTFDIIYELRIKNLIPILCHPERYAFIINSPENINKFIDEGCLFQINSGSILGHFGREVQKQQRC